MQAITFLYLAGGLGVLTLGAELLVKGASRLALSLGITPLVVGLTIVSFGTSAPELAVSLKSALGGQPDLALGNVVGSNIFNVLFILGISALIIPLLVHRQLIRFDVPIMLAVSILTYVLCLDSMLQRYDGALLFMLGAIYTFFIIKKGKEAKDNAPDEDSTKATKSEGKLWQNLFSIALGLLLLVAGSHYFLEGAIAVARVLGMSELTIGLTLVAGGTSLPEVATSILAAIRGQRDIAVGNVVGSNIYNLVTILGLTALLSPIPVAETTIGFDLPVMIAVALSCLPIFFTGHCIARWEGGLFLAYYIAYLIYLYLAAQQIDSTAAFRSAMILFVIPLTAVTLSILAFRTWREKRI